MTDSEKLQIYRQTLEFIAADVYGTGAKSGTKAHEVAKAALKQGED